MPLSDPTSHYYSHNAARLAEEYDRAGPGLLPIIEKICPDRSASFLDYGCGTGRDLARLNKRGYTNLMGYDPSIEMIAAGRAKYPQIENYLHHELTNIAAAFFDLMICSAVLQHIEAGKLCAFLKKLTSCLQPGAGSHLLLSYPLQWPGYESEPRRVGFNCFCKTLFITAERIYGLSASPPSLTRSRANFTDSSFKEKLILLYM